MKLADMTLGQLKEMCTKTMCNECQIRGEVCKKLELSPDHWKLDVEVQDETD